MAQDSDSTRSDLYRDDPYFYSAYYYPEHYAAYSTRSTPDPDDFTEGDEAILEGGEAARGDVEAFEENMGAS